MELARTYNKEKLRKNRRTPSKRKIRTSRLVVIRKTPLSRNAAGAITTLNMVRKATFLKTLRKKRQKKP